VLFFRENLALVSLFCLEKNHRAQRVYKKILHTQKVQQAAETNCKGRINGTVSFVVQLFADQ